MKSIEVQARIKHNAEEMQEYMRDMARWENSVKQRDSKLRSTRGRTVQPVRLRDGGTVKVQSTAMPVSGTTQAGALPRKTAAAHTYDRGYSKWEKFDVNNALEEADASVQPLTVADQLPLKHGPTAATTPTTLTPANIVDPRFLQQHVLSVASARGVYNDRDPEEVEREVGNDYFKRGDFSKAVRSYTRCLGMKKSNYVAFSNRAMAYLKLREFDKAEMDATCALDIEPSHVKSLLRRATARTALGKFRAGLVDLKRAQALEPSNRTVAAETWKAQELLKAAMNRAPALRIAVTRGNDEERRGVLHDIPIQRNALGMNSVYAAADGKVACTASQPYHVSQSASASLSPQRCETTESSTPTTSATSVISANGATSATTEFIGKNVTDLIGEEASTYAVTTPETTAAAAAKASLKLVTKHQTKSTKKVDVSQTKPRKRQAKSLQGSYDLERHLRIAGDDVGKLTALFQELHHRDAQKIFSKNLEVDVVVQFLLGAGRVYAVTEPSTVCAWFEAITRAPQFELMKMLLSTSQKVSLLEVLCQLQGIEIERVRSIQRAYEL